MTTLTPADHIAALRADLVAAEAEWDRIDTLGDTAAAVRVRAVMNPRLGRLRRAIAVIERTTS